MVRAKKGEVVGSCQFCGRPLRYAGTGRKPETCRRRECQRRLHAAKMRRQRARLAVPTTLG